MGRTAVVVGGGGGMEIRHQKVTVAQEDGGAIGKMRRDVALARRGEVQVASA